MPFDTWWEFGDRGLKQVPQQILLNLNAALIVLLIVPLSWAARKMRTLSAMLVGMSAATLGVLVAGWTTSGWILLLGIVFFSMGEMWTGPKKNEYLGLIAPPGKKGLYLGYVNIPVGVGVGIGSYLGGWVYDNYGEKATLALKQLSAEPALIAPRRPMRRLERRPREDPAAAGNTARERAGRGTGRTGRGRGRRREHAQRVLPPRRGTDHRPGVFVRCPPRGTPRRSEREATPNRQHNPAGQPRTRPPVTKKPWSPCCAVTCTSSPAGWTRSAWASSNCCGNT